jgi:hypothetical protein
MTRSPAEFQPEIEASRETLARDVAALRGRATPRRLLGDVVETTRVQGRRAGARVVEAAREPPLQLAVIGAILAGAGAWLLARLIANRRRPRTLPERIKTAIRARVPWVD